MRALFTILFLGTLFLFFTHGFLIGEERISEDKVSSGPTRIDRDILAARQQAVHWLKEQIVPNSTVPDPDPRRRRLIVSYRVPKTDPLYPYIYSRSFIYDNALAIITFTMSGDYREAEALLGALRRVIRQDGSFWFAYNTVNSWPSEEYHESAIVRTGSIAWAGYAATFYLRARLEENENLLEEDPMARRFLGMARDIASFLLARQVTDKSDRRYGLITGGWGEYTLTMQSDSPSPVESFKSNDVRWVSMEHNIDCFFFLRDLYRLTDEAGYRKASKRIEQGLLTMWSEEYGQFYRGIKEDQKIDPALPLDGASWGSLFLLSISQKQKALHALRTIESKFFHESDGVLGCRPYYAEPVYEDRSVNAYYFHGKPSFQWQELDIVWGEGSLGAATAYIKAGEMQKGLELLRSMLALREGSGFKYASCGVPYQFSEYPSVASTAWFVIAVEVLKQDKTRLLFWGEQ